MRGWSIIRVKEEVMAELGSSHSFSIKLATDKQMHEIELLTEENLRIFGMKANDIKIVSVNFAVKGYLYEELGVARPTHPCAGSACAVFQDPYGNENSLDCIIYHDPNVRRSHADGLPHWNVELRCMKNGIEINRSNEVVPHIIEDASEIEITSNCDGSVDKQKILRDQPVQKQP